MSVDLPDNIKEWVAMATVAILGGALGLRRFQRQWTIEGTDIAGNQAKQDVIELMRDEMTRLSKVNSELALQVNKFQLENIQLTARLSTVTTQMSELQIENAKLGTEVIELREAIKEFREMFSACKECPNGFVGNEQ